MAGGNGNGKAVDHFCQGYIVQFVLCTITFVNQIGISKLGAFIEYFHDRKNAGDI